MRHGGEIPARVMQGMTDIVLETRALTRRFGNLVAVDGVVLQVGSAQIFGLLGSNGAGKTTMIKMLTTLLPPSAGTGRPIGRVRCWSTFRPRRREFAEGRWASAASQHVRLSRRGRAVGSMIRSVPVRALGQ